jgi:hypothetical protein
LWSHSVILPIMLLFILSLDNVQRLNKIMSSYNCQSFLR